MQAVTAETSAGQVRYYPAKADGTSVEPVLSSQKFRDKLSFGDLGRYRQWSSYALHNRCCSM